MGLNLRLAVQRQKRVLLLFFLTILLPAVVLGIFGLRALQADRFRIEQLMKREQEEAMRAIRAALAAYLQSISDSLVDVARRPETISKKWTALGSTVRKFAHAGRLPPTVLVLAPSGESFFAVEGFLSLPEDNLEFASPGKEVFQEAERYEFALNDLARAVEKYELLVSNDGLRLAALNALGRCHFGLGNYRRAASAYQSVLEYWPEVLDSETAVFPLIAGLQTDRALKKIENGPQGLSFLLAVYRELIEGKWIVSADTVQFYLSEYEKEIETHCRASGDSNLCSIYPKVKNKKEARLARIRELEQLRAQLLPFRTLAEDKIFRISGSTSLAIVVPSGPRGAEDLGENRTVVAAVVNESSLLNHMIRTRAADQRIHLRVANGDGRVLYQSISAIPAGVFLQEELGEGLPRWKMTLFHDPADDPLPLRRNFYLVLTLLLVVLLLFGAFLTARTVYHELEVIRMKSDFVSVVSHEFKSPITSMRTLMERLQAGVVTDSSKRQQYFDLICGELQRLTRLINNVLDFSRIEAGRKEYHFVETDVVGVLRNLLATFEAGAVQRGFKVETEIAADLPRVTVDPDSISQAVLNLLDNAIKYSTEEKLIRVGAQRNGHFVLVHVTDRGQGIRDEEKTKIFEESYRSRDAAGRGVPGVGLGLAIVRHIMKAHGGDVTVQSEVGRGSTFTLCIPITSEPADSVAPLKKS